MCWLRHAHRKTWTTLLTRVFAAGHAPPSSIINLFLLPWTSPTPHCSTRLLFRLSSARWDWIRMDCHWECRYLSILRFFLLIYLWFLNKKLLSRSSLLRTLIASSSPPLRISKRDLVVGCQLDHCSGICVELRTTDLPMPHWYDTRQNTVLVWDSTTVMVEEASHVWMCYCTINLIAFLYTLPCR